ncbi:hypothetical protein [Dyella terrae]|uniref:hypothetical protein n=1 Tax=Dyella terrae TaxID=522259 RepID=UPI001EFE5198|nr:hypothetical protein [Dyella terrae]
MSCPLGRDGTHVVAVTSKRPVADTRHYDLRVGNDKPVALFDSTGRADSDDPNFDASRGSDVQIECLGAPEKVLVISGEFTSNFLQGVAIRFNTAMHRWERVDFAERTRPIAVYLEASGMSVIFANGGQEVAGRYLVYRYPGQADAMAGPVAVNTLPAGRDIETIRLPNRPKP